MGEMIGNIAHQWRQPLNVLGLYLQELPIMYDKPEFDREFLVSSIRRSMDVIMHMSRTIDDFRYFFLNDKEKVSVSTTQVIGKTLTLIEDSFLSQRIHIVCNLGEGSTFIGYPNEYSQVLLNILLNARDALVTKNIVEGTIFVNAFDDGGKSVVTVSDNAGGIAADIIDKVFDPYFTTKGPDKGTGIGLFMSKTIIENNMGGSLTVSNVGSGAEFRIEM
jgi:signal transduction histidine kinase